MTPPHPPSLALVTLAWRKSPAVPPAVISFCTAWPRCCKDDLSLATKRYGLPMVDLEATVRCLTLEQLTAAIISRDGGRSAAEDRLERERKEHPGFVQVALADGSRRGLRLVYSPQMSIADIIAERQCGSHNTATQGSQRASCVLRFALRDGRKAETSGSNQDLLRMVHGRQAHGKCSNCAEAHSPRLVRPFLCTLAAACRTLPSPRTPDEHSSCRLRAPIIASACVHQRYMAVAAATRRALRPLSAAAVFLQRR